MIMMMMKQSKQLKYNIFGNHVIYLCRYYKNDDDDDDKALGNRVDVLSQEELFMRVGEVAKIEIEAKAKENQQTD